MAVRVMIIILKTIHASILSRLYVIRNSSIIVAVIVNTMPVEQSVNLAIVGTYATVPWLNKDSWLHLTVLNADATKMDLSVQTTFIH